MGLSSVLLGLTLLTALASGLPSKECVHKLKESVDPPRNWVKHGVPAPSHIIQLKIGLPQPNFHVLEKHLYEISDPFHERYGDHLSKEQVDELVAPHPESLSSVTAWLADHGIGENDIVRSSAQDWITIKAPVSLVEKMLDTVRLTMLPGACPLSHET